MIKFNTTVAETNGVSHVAIEAVLDEPTALEIGTLRAECKIGFGRHADLIQTQAERTLEKLGRGG